MTPKEDEKERREVIRRLKREDKEADAKLLKASHDHSIARVNKHNAEMRLLRAKGLPEGNHLCMMCWVNHERIIQMEPVPSPDANRFDLWKCPDCGHIRDEPTGPR